MSDARQNLIGRWVQVRSGGPIGITGAYTVEIGVLESCDDAWLVLGKPNGESIYLPADHVHEIVVIQPLRLAPADTLLRPAEKPIEDDTLLRPAQGVSEADPKTLLRASAPPEEQEEP